MKRDKFTEEEIDLDELFSRPLTSEPPLARRKRWAGETALALIVVLALLLRWGWMSNDKLGQMENQSATAQVARADSQNVEKTAQAKQQGDLRATAQAAEERVNTALAKQLGAQARLMMAQQDSRQEMAVLLAIEIDET